MNCLRRYDSLRRRLRGLDAILITNLVNVRYLCGFTGSSGCLLLTKEGGYFITDFRYREQACEEVGGAPWEVRVEARGAFESALRVLGRMRDVRAVGFEPSISYSKYSLLARKFPGAVALGDVVENIRLLKDEAELALMREAVRRAELALLDVKPRIRPGVTERSLAMRLESRIRHYGSTRLPFDIIIASGTNGSRPHAGASERRLAPGELITIDWGAEAGGYCSDMTRTFLLKGTSGDMARKRLVYNLVLEANEAAIGAARKGMGIRELDGVARAVIERAGYGECFGHGLGHGVGLEVHEAPSVSRRGRGRLKAGMVFTIEPGVYVEGLGGVRIEDMVFSGAECVEVLTGLPKGLEIL